MRHDEKKPPRNVLPDLIIPAAALIFTIYYLTTITEVPWISQASAIFVGCLLFVTIGAWILRTVFRIRRAEEKLSLDGLTAEAPTQVRRIVLLVLTIGYVVMLETLGFTLSTLLFLFLAIVVLSSVENWKTALRVSLSCAIVGYVIFILIFKTRFPEGWIERTVEQLIRHGA